MPWLGPLELSGIAVSGIAALALRCRGLGLLSYLALLCQALLRLGLLRPSNVAVIVFVSFSLIITPGPPACTCFRRLRRIFLNDAWKSELWISYTMPICFVTFFSCSAFKFTIWDNYWNLNRFCYKNCGG